MPCASLRTRARALLALWIAPGLAGCIGSRIVYPVQPTLEELAEFEAAGPPDVPGEIEGVQTMHLGGPYRVVAGDLLRVELPGEVQGKVEEESAPAAELRSRGISYGEAAQRSARRGRALEEAGGGARDESGRAADFLGLGEDSA